MVTLVKFVVFFAGRFGSASHSAKPSYAGSTARAIRNSSNEEMDTSCSASHSAKPSYAGSTARAIRNSSNEEMDTSGIGTYGVATSQSSMIIDLNCQSTQLSQHLYPVVNSSEVNFELDDVPMDGNCFFHCLARTIYPDLAADMAATLLRFVICEFVFINWAVYGPLAITSHPSESKITDPDSYRSYMIGSKRMATLAEIKAASEKFKAKITVWIPNATGESYVTPVFQHEDKSDYVFDIHLSGNHYQILRFVRYPERPVEPNLNILSLSENHEPKSKRRKMEKSDPTDNITDEKTAPSHPNESDSIASNVISYQIDTNENTDEKAASTSATQYDFISSDLISAHTGNEGNTDIAAPPLSTSPAQLNTIFLAIDGNMSEKVASSPSFQTSSDVQKRSREFMKTERELIQLCAHYQVNYDPPALHEEFVGTRARRKLMRDKIKEKESDTSRSKKLLGMATKQQDSCTDASDKGNHPVLQFNEKDDEKTTASPSPPDSPVIQKRSNGFIKAEQELIQLCAQYHVKYVPPPLHEDLQGTRARRKMMRAKIRELESDATRSKKFLDMEKELEELCATHGVEYIPPGEKEDLPSTRARRKALRSQLADLYGVAEDSLPTNEEFVDATREFEQKQMSYSFSTCPVCCEKRLNMKLTSGQCARCFSDKNEIKMFSAENLMDPGPIPECLNILSIVEQQFIARIAPVQCIRMLGHGGLASHGHCVWFSQAVEEPAKILPNLPEKISHIKVVRVGQNKRSNAMRVRRHAVHDALIWKKQNCEAYKDITISEERLASLPLDGELRDGHLIESGSTGTHNLGPAPEQVMPDDSEEMLTESFVPLPDPPMDIKKAVQEAVQNVLGPNAESSVRGNTASFPWPSTSGDPLSEFSTRNIYSNSFPVLFPTGAGDFCMNRPKTCESMDKWAEHLMNYHDGRFAQHPYFKFIVHNVALRKKLLDKGKFVVKQTLGDGQMSIEELRNILNNDKESLCKKIARFSSDIRGSTYYWRQRRKELQALVQYHISQGNGLPSLYITLSCAEFYWKPLRRILEEYLDVSLDSKSDLYKAVKENPHIVVHYFDLRAQDFIKIIVVKIFRVNSYWIKYEFAIHRGQIHLHGLCWRRDMEPHQLMYQGICDELNKEEIAELLEKFAEDALGMTAMHPAGFNEEGESRKDKWYPPEGTASPVTPEDNPLFKLHSEVVDHEKDLIDLVNLVCLHSCSDYCLRNTRSGKRVCRMIFGTEEEPGKPLREKPAIIKDLNGSKRLEMKRDHPRMVQISAPVLESWRANCDISLILSESDPKNPSTRDIIPVSKYLTEYVGKGMEGSGALGDVLASVAADANPETSCAKNVVNKFLMKTVKRDISSAEASHEIAGIPLYRCNHKFVNFSLSGTRMLQRIGQNVTRPTLLDRYVSRKDIDDRTLYQFICSFGVPVIQGNTYATYPLTEEYARTQLILHWPNWRKLEEITHGKPYLDVFKEFVKSDQCPNFVKSDVERASKPEQCYNEDDAFEPDLHADQPEYLSVLQPQMSAYDDFCRDFDYDDGGEDYDWSGKYPFLENAAEFWETLKEEPICNTGKLKVPEVDLNSMNEDQRLAFNIIMDALEKSDEDNTYEGMRMVVAGKAGSGKSYLINCVINAVVRKYGTNKAVRVLCPTGSSASLIDGAATIHSVLKVPCGPKAHGDLSTPSGDAAIFLQTALDGLKVLLVDERSLVGARVMGWMEHHLKFGLKIDADWGGVPVVIFLGDGKQLPAVCDSPVYSYTGKAIASSRGAFLWRAFTTVVELKKSMRQDSSEAELRRALDHLRNYEVDNQDVDFLQQFQWNSLESKFSKTTMEKMKDDALFVFPTLEEEWDHNSKQILKTNLIHPIAKIKCENHGIHASSAPAQKCHGLQKTLFLCEDAKVVLTINVNNRFHLFNGSVGKVVDIVYGPGRSPKDGFPAYILVDFPKFTGPAIILEHPTYVAVPVVQRRVECNCCSRKQLPLRLGWGLTIHKCQGMNIGQGELNRHVVITPGSCGFESRNPGALYVAASRAKCSGSDDRLPDLAFHEKVILNADRLKHKPNGKIIKEREIEARRLQNAAHATRRRFGHLDNAKAFEAILTTIPHVNNHSPSPNEE